MSRRTCTLIAALGAAASCGDSVSVPAPMAPIAEPVVATVLAPEPWTFDAECPAGATRWVAAVSGSWLDAGRWSAGVPTASLPACIDLPGSYVVTMSNSGGATAQSLFLGVPDAATQPTLNIPAGILSTGNATIHGKVDLRSGTGVNAGLDVADLLAVSPTGTLTSFHDGTKTYEAARIHNAGRIEVGPRSVSVARLNLHANAIVNRGALVSPLSRELYLRGTGGVGAPAVGFEAGMVDASGKFEQTNGSIAVSGGTVTGRVRLIAGSELRLEHNAGGRFDLSRGSGIVNTSTPTWKTRVVGTIGSGQHVWLGNNHITVDASGVVNEGQLTIHSDAAIGTLPASLITTGGATLTNAATGTITFFGAGSATLRGSVVNDGLITTSTGLVSMHMQLRPDPLINRGTIRVVAASSLNATPGAGEPVAHVVNDGGTLELAGNYSQTGGVFEHRGGTISSTGGVILSGVHWLGFGRWGRPLALSGTSIMEPDGTGPAGLVEIGGDYSPSATTTTRVQLLGDDDHDRIAVAGTARFAGTLSVSTPGFVPRPCQTFRIATFASRAGTTFANAATPIDIGNGMKVRQVYDDNALTLVAYDAAGPNVSPTEVTVSTDGTTASYDVCLGTGASDVVTVQPDDQVTVDKATLTFGATSLPQRVTVSAAPGATREEAFIRHTASSGAPVATVRVVIQGVIPPDTEAPVTTAAVTPGANEHGWHRSDAQVQLTSTDAGSGVARIDWSLSGAQAGSGSAPGSVASVDVTAEGVTTLTYSARDVAGNVEAPRSLVIRIDRTVPTIVVTRDPPPGADGWNHTNVVATFSATDALSGVDGPAIVDVLFTEDGANQSATRSFSDKAGNVASATVSGISIDRRPAAIACSATPNEIWPPNGRLVPVSIAVTVERAQTFALVAVRSSEPAADDIVDFTAGTADTQGQLRATRAGSSKDGRVYTFEYRTVGGAAPAIATCEVRVPHDRRRSK